MLRLLTLADPITAKAQRLLACAMLFTVLTSLVGCDNSTEPSSEDKGVTVETNVGTRFVYQIETNAQFEKALDTSSTRLLSKSGMIGGRKHLLVLEDSRLDWLEFWDVDKTGDMWYYREVNFTGRPEDAFGSWVRYPSSGSGEYQSVTIDTVLDEQSVARRTWESYTTKALGPEQITINGKQWKGQKIEVKYELKVWENDVISWPSMSSTGYKLLVPELGLTSLDHTETTMLLEPPGTTFNKRLLSIEE